MKIRETTTTKKLDLLLDFNTYILKNPAAAKKIPRKACIVFEVPNDKYLTRVNRALAREAIKDGEKCVRAIKHNSVWTIEALPA